MKKKPITKSSPRKKTKDASGDVISVNNVGSGTAIAVGRNASAKVISNSSSDLLDEWRMDINEKIDELTNLSKSEREDIKQQIEKISAEAQKGSKAEKSRLEKLINTLAVMSPDIFEVVIATLQSPLTGIGLVINKIGEKIKLEKRNN